MSPSSPLESDTTSFPPSQPSSDLHLSPGSPTLLLTFSQDDITHLIHHEGSSFPPVRPTHWTSEELHRAMGCRCFRNYKHILQTSLNGKWIDGGEFPLALGSCATILKANRGDVIDQATSYFLEVTHVDIAFGDCASVGGFCYALILVDRATCYNWVYGLKDLLGDSILLALCYFKADAGSYARCFHLDCDAKLFGLGIWEHLINNNSNIMAAAAGRQSANGLVESHWKTMVHMSRAYLTEKQMPRSFWFFSIVHSAWMMNAIPGKLHGLVLILAGAVCFIRDFFLVHSYGRVVLYLCSAVTY